MLEWPAIIALGALILAGIALLSRLLDQSLPRREHNEFKEASTASARLLAEQMQESKRHIEERLVIREFDKWRQQITRDFDRIEDDLRLLDAAKPSTGELQEAMKAVGARVTHLEETVRILNIPH